MKGMYLFFSYLGTAGLVEEVERNLRLTDSVIRDLLGEDRRERRSGDAHRPR